jgi:hypothetical protein
MNRFANPFIVFILALSAALCAAVSCAAQSTAQSCPVSFSRLQMPIRHRGGMSTPMVQVSFTNETKKKIDRAKFGLIVLDSDSSQAPYGKALTFSAGADPGKVVSAEWALEMEKVDIEHLGETVYLQSVEFADGTTWKDDGKQQCRDDVYFGPK